MKNKKAIVFYSLLCFIIWQLCLSLTNILESFSNRDINNNFFSFQMVKNDGAAFGVFNDNPYILGTLGVFALCGILFYVARYMGENDKIKILFASMFSAGILGNTVERFSNGYVFDFIKINLFDFPVFNLYDILITGSVFLYIVFYIRRKLIKRTKI